MKAKNQRLTLAVLASVVVIGAAFLAMSALKDKAAFFYSPADLKREKVEIGRPIRLGGMVAGHSIARTAYGVTVSFVVTDGQDSLPVTFTGITPDLFKENSGVIAEGSLVADGSFMATNLLAKHDEKYMPPQLSGKLHKTGPVER